METLKAISSRRSIRSFKDKEVSKVQIEKILDAGARAPSAYGRQPWKFVVISDKKRLEEISIFDPYASAADEAAIGILVCGDLDIENNEVFLIQDCAAAVENMLLVATALELGSLWTTIYPFKDMVQKFRVKFSLSDNMIPFTLVLLGYAK